MLIIVGMVAFVGLGAGAYVLKKKSGKKTVIPDNEPDDIDDEISEDEDDIDFYDKNDDEE